MGICRIYVFRVQHVFHPGAPTKAIIGVIAEEHGPVDRSGELETLQEGPVLGKEHRGSGKQAAGQYQPEYRDPG